MGAKGNGKDHSGRKSIRGVEQSESIAGLNGAPRKQEIDISPIKFGLGKA